MKNVSWVSFLLNALSVPIGFYLIFNHYGAKPAIALCVVVASIQMLYARWKGESPSPFLILSGAFTIGFGTIDLLIASPQFFRLEPAVQNFIIATVFLVSQLVRFPVAEKFIAALPAAVRPGKGPGAAEFLHRVIWAWIVYFYFKAAVYLYLAFAVDLGLLVILRTAIGMPSLVLMFAAQLWFGRRLARIQAAQK